MRYYSNYGWLELIVGCMQSGKSAEVRRRLAHALRVKQHVVHVWPRLARNPTPAERGPAPLIVDDAASLLRRIPHEAQVVAIEEAQFFDDALPQVVAELTARGVRVICAGLDTTFTGATFGVIGDLLAQAELVDKFHAICGLCGNPATRTQRLIGDRPVDSAAPEIDTGAAARYEPRCRACHQVPDPTPAR